MIQPIQPNKPEPSFGIYMKTKKTQYGYWDYGIYKGHKISIFHDNRDNTKLQYVSHNELGTWIKSKLEYFVDGVRKILRSEAKDNKR